MTTPPRAALAFAAALTLAATGEARALGILLVEGQPDGPPASLDLAFAPGPGTTGARWAEARAQRPGRLFAWVLPVPAGTTTARAPRGTFFDELRRVTGVRFTMDFDPPPPATGCGGEATTVAPPVGEPPIGIISSPRAAVRSQQVFAPDTFEAFEAWLVAGSWSPSATTRARLQALAADGHALLAVSFEADEPTVALAPVRYDTPTHEPAFRPADTDFAEGSITTIRVTVADVRRVDPSGAALAGIDTDALAFDGSDPETGTNWHSLLARATAGGAWFVESARPASVLLPQSSDFDAREFLKSGRYVTRLATAWDAGPTGHTTTFTPRAAADPVEDVSPDHEVSAAGVRGFAPTALPLLLPLLLRRVRRRESHA